MPQSPAKPFFEPTVLRAKNLGRSIPGKDLIREVDFSLGRGETLAIVGPSGSGKSTLLRLLNRLDEPTSGTVLLDGTDYKQIPPRELRRRVGMVTQRPFLFPGTVDENLQFGPRQRNEKLSNADVDRLLAGVGLTGYAARDVANLSGGEAQRVSFARMLANQPEVLLLDEPTSALDEESKRGIEELVVRIMQQGWVLGADSDRSGGKSLSCVLVTHDLAQAVRIAQHALLLVGGRVVKSGSIEEVLNAKDAFP
jgi:putative ABC transport system ATP-binding protein